MSVLPGMDLFIGNYSRITCRNEPDGMDSSGRFLRMGILDTTVRVEKN